MEVNKKVEAALKISFIISIPSCFGLYFMSYPILNLIFNGQTGGYKILQYLSISIPFIILAQTTTAILQGTGIYKKPVINLLIGCTIKTLATFLLVPILKINVYGAVIGTILGYVVASFLNVKDLKRYLGVSINYYDVMIKPLYASVVMTFFVVFIYKYVYNYTMSINISCLASVFAGVVIYGILVFIFGIFDYAKFKKRLIKK